VLSLAVGALAGPVALDPGASAAVAAGATGSAGSVGARTRSADATEATPLTVQMIGMSPAVVPAKGDLVISGVVTNASTENWSDINVAPFMSAEPMTTRDQLLEAAATDPAATVGSRLSDPGTYVNVGDLLPGESTTFTLHVPRASMGITGEPGVYWIGVHALGTSAEGRDLVADGRARSFIPLVPRQRHRRSVDVSLVVPLREKARRAADGSLNGPSRWAALTAADGRLTRLAQFAASAGPAPVTWEVDPAVLDALQDYSNGNPALSLGGSRRVQQPRKSPSPTPSSSASPSAAADPGTGSHAPSQEDRQRAGSVLSTFLGAVRGGSLLTMPYGDPDVAALVRDRPSLLTRAQSLAARRMQAHGLAGTPAIAPPDALFDPDLLGGIPGSTLLVLGDGGRLATQPYGRLPTGQPLVLTDERTSSGGPTRTGAAEPLALRQRILAEAALDLSARRPIVVRFPMRWEPGAYWREADFFAALRRPWVHLVPVHDGGATTFTGTLSYGKAQRAAEIGPDNVATTRALAHTGDVLADLLANANDVDDRLSGAAMQASAYSARSTPRVVEDQVHALDLGVRDRMRRVQVTGTDFVTLSGGSGTLTVTLVNGLRQPVDVGLRTRTGNPAVRVESADPVALGPGQRTTLRLTVHSSAGLHQVSMYPVTGDAQVVGTPFTFNVRTSQVGQVIWYVLIAGGALLFVMILRRIVLRIRNRQWRLEDSA
jgi:hypothetical protein